MGGSSKPAPVDPASAALADQLKKQQDELEEQKKSNLRRLAKEQQSVIQRSKQTGGGALKGETKTTGGKPTLLG